MEIYAREILMSVLEIPSSRGEKEKKHLTLPPIQVVIHHKLGAPMAPTLFF